MFLFYVMEGLIDEMTLEQRSKVKNIIQLISRKCVKFNITISKSLIQFITHIVN